MPAYSVPHSQLCYIVQDHLPRNITTHRGQCPLTIILDTSSLTWPQANLFYLIPQWSLPEMTLGYVRLTAEVNRQTLFRVV